MAGVEAANSVDFPIEWAVVKGVSSTAEVFFCDKVDIRGEAWRDVYTTEGGRKPPNALLAGGPAMLLRRGIPNERS